MSNLAIIFQATAFVKNAFELLRGIFTKTDGIETEKVERAEKFFYEATKIEMSLADLMLHLCGNPKKMVDFLSVVKDGKKNDIKVALKDLSTIFRLPEIFRSPEKDVYSLFLNRLTRENRKMIEKTNTLAEALKEDFENVTLLSEFYVYVAMLVAENLMDDYEKLVRFKIETVNLILGKEINSVEVDKEVSKNVEILQNMCKSYQRFCYEFDKKSSEIKKKLQESLFMSSNDE